MKGRTRIILIVAGVVLLLVIVLANLNRSAGGKIAVQAGDVRKGTVTATVRAPGRVQPETQVKLSANVPGEVRTLPIHEGDSVRKGQFLLQIDDAQYRAQVGEANAALAAARSNLRLAEASLAQSQSVLKRKEALSTQNLVSAEELDQARTAASTDQSRVEAGREDVRRLQSTLQAAHDNLRKTRFISPINGTVTQLTIERGEIAVIGTMNNPGTVLLTVADLSRMKVEADVDETDVATIRIGQEATVKVDALPDTSLVGHVTQIANSPLISGADTQEQETNFKVDVTIDNPPPILRPGMTADVEIRTARRDSVLAVPIQSVVIRTPEDLKPPVTKKTKKRGGAQAETAEKATPSGERPKQEEIRGVFVIVDGKAEFRRVKTGIASDTDFEVLGEIKPGEKVVIGPHKTLRSLKPGQRVKIEEPKKAKGKESQ
ncbi:MAG TPA: efflux RND transporter periplasmic adaptor subunit [Candidatus Eisenbacteria bacterium]|nr:efflux RND transporter periplasmic adaptor subunit [Candidatus Eisenbacteria bacterium]